MGSCDVLIAVVGKRWLAAADEDGGRRLDHRDDFVRLEIETALKRGTRVIPVLVDDASMPRSGELPEELKSLVRLHAVKVSQDRFRSDSDLLITAVDQALKQTRAEGRKRGFTLPGKRMWLSIAGAVTVLALVAVASIYFTSHRLKPTTHEVQLQPSAEQSPAIVAIPPRPSEDQARKFQQTPAPISQEPSPDMKKLLDMAQLLRQVKRPAAEEKVIGQPASADIRATIRKNYDRLSEALAKKDIQAFKAVYSADFVVRNGAIVKNAETYFSEIAFAFFASPTVSYDIQDVVITAPDTAVVTVKSSVNSTLINVTETDRDTWKYVRDQWLCNETNVLE